MSPWTKPRTVFAFLFYFAFLWLIITNKKIPQELNTVVSILLGHYFGQKQAEAKYGERLS